MDHGGNSANTVLTGLLQPEPVRASQLSTEEAHQHDRLSTQKPLGYGCTELDSAVLLGGLRRGSIVGVSADDGDGFGLLMGLQVMTKAILHRSTNRALVITPKSQASISGLIMDIARSELSKSNLATANIQQKCLASLDSVMLSVVFDMDGLWQTLSELQQPGTVGSHSSNAANTDGLEALDSMEDLAREILDSKDDDELQSVAQDGSGFRAQATAPSDKSRGQNSSNSLPDIIVITHFSTLLTSLFATREKKAAHKSLELLKARLRLLSSSLTTNPLILLLNSNISEAIEVPKGSVADASGFGAPSRARTVEPTLRSVFTVPPPVRPSRPSFGLVFKQFLDLHLLCTNIPTLLAVSSCCCHQQATTSYRCDAPRHSPTLVEVLQDDSNRSFTSNSKNATLEQRWAVLEVAGNCIVNLCQG